MKIITYTLLFVVFASSSSVYSRVNKTQEMQQAKVKKRYQLKLNQQKNQIIEKQQNIPEPSLETLRKLQNNQKKFNLED